MALLDLAQTISSKYWMTTMIWRRTGGRVSLALKLFRFFLHEFVVVARGYFPIQNSHFANAGEELSRAHVESRLGF